MVPFRERHVADPEVAPGLALDMDPQTLDRRLLLGEGAEPLVPVVKCGDRRSEASRVDRTRGRGTVSSKP